MERSIRFRCSAGAAALALVMLAARPAAGQTASDRRVVTAARLRDRAAVIALVKAKVDVNAAQADGATALHWAAHWNDVEMADALIRAGARVEAGNEYGATPLWLASVNGSAPMVERLLKAGANAGAPIHSGETPLMSAARAGSVEAVARLLVAGTPVDSREQARGQTALMWAAAERHPAVVRALVEKGAGVNLGSRSGFTPLMFAAREGDLESVRVLVERGADVNAAAADGSTPLLVATVRGHATVAEFLLDRSADPNAAAAGYTALHWAAGTWETSTSFDYRFTDGEWAALVGIPVRQDRFRLMKALLAKGADVNARTTRTPPRYGFTLFGQQQATLVGVTPFFLAAIVADVEVMKFLVAAGADPTIADSDGTTPLMVAAGRGRVDNETRVPEAAALEATRVALDLKNDVRATNTAGETALHAAALAGLDSVVKLLVDRGAPVNAKTKAGKTPLATAEGTVVAMQLVVRANTAKLLKSLGGVTQ